MYIQALILRNTIAHAVTWHLGRPIVFFCLPRKTDTDWLSTVNYVLTAVQVSHLIQDPIGPVAGWDWSVWAGGWEASTGTVGGGSRWKVGSHRHDGRIGADHRLPDHRPGLGLARGHSLSLRKDMKLIIQNSAHNLGGLEPGKTHILQHNQILDKSEWIITCLEINDKANTQKHRKNAKLPWHQNI